MSATAKAAAAGVPLKIMIVNNFSDTEFANYLNAALNARGFMVFLDTKDIFTGFDWKNSLDRMIDEADVVVSVVSEATINSQYCNYELNRILGSNKKIIAV
jgi:TIR domain